MMVLRRALFLVALFTFTFDASAEVPQGYQRIAEIVGVPSSVLYAIAMTESGAALASGGRHPWPWSLNVEGRSLRYRTRVETWHALTGFLTQGVTRIDIGLMQVNWAYHRDALGDPWTALDPYHNLHVGAVILREEFRATGDWWQAVGRYHAPNHIERADRYRARVVNWYRRIATEDASG
jgi:Transglycosylase SLT domain